jgi:hypothetical protein
VRLEAGRLESLKAMTRLTSQYAKYLASWPSSFPAFWPILCFRGKLFFLNHLLNSGLIDISGEVKNDSFKNR